MGLRGCRSGECGEPLDEGKVLSAGLGEARLGFEVVVAVGQAEAAGVDLSDDSRRRVDVGVGVEGERGVDADGLKVCDGGLERGTVVDGVDLLEERLEGTDAGDVNGFDIRAGGVEIAGELGGGAGGLAGASGDLVKDDA